LIIGVKS